jgi:hypothetical protein
LRLYTPPEPPNNYALTPVEYDIGTYPNIHALRPASPPLETRNAFNVRRPAYGVFTPTTADSTRPSLEWEPFPRGYAWAPESADAARISGVTYEIRLYNALRRYVSGEADLLFPERVIYERAGLAQPVHQPETELEPCQVHFWTARARFRLDGRVRVTPWMSVGAVWRGMPAFATPPAQGKKRDCFYGN